MSEEAPESKAGQVFARNFRDHLEGRLAFGEWFEVHNALERRFGPQPWPGPEVWLASAPVLAPAAAS